MRPLAEVNRSRVVLLVFREISDLIEPEKLAESLSESLKPLEMEREQELIRKASEGQEQ